MNESSIRIRGMIILSWTAIVSLIGFAVVAGWWALQPVQLPTVDEPLPILNPDREVSAGDPLIIELTVSKPQELRVDRGDRRIACKSGLLIPLTSPGNELPTGDFTLISDTILVPASITIGDECTVTFSVTYEVNPIRHEEVSFESEPFTVVEG